MANRETKLQIIVDAQNRTQGAFEAVRDNLQGIQGTLTKLGAVGTVGFGALTAALAYSTREAMQAEEAQNRLVQILRTSRKATQEQIAPLLRQAKALQRVGVVAEDNVIQTQAQLATFDLTAESIERLTPAVLNYVVAEKGAAASTEDFKQLTNGLAQALQGNFTSLTRTGFVLDDATRALIANGTEAERTAALVKVLDSTYAGFNQSARDTAAGSLQALKNEFNDLTQIVGEAFLPVIRNLVQAIRPAIEQVTAWIEAHPELTKNILIGALAFTALLAVLLPISIALPGLVMLFTALGAVIAFVTALSAPLILAIGAIVAVLAVLAANGYATKEAWANVWLGMKVIAADAVNAIVRVVESMINFVIDKVNTAIRLINKVISLANNVPGIGKLIPKIKEIGQVELGSISPESIPLGEIAGTALRATTPPIINMAGSVFLDSNVAEKIGDLIMSKLKLSNQL